MKRRTIYILYGKRAAHLYSEGGIGALLSNIDSLDLQISERHFSTNAEYIAYLYGIEDSLGWEDYIIMNNSDYKQYEQEKDK